MNKTLLRLLTAAMLAVTLAACQPNDARMCSANAAELYANPTC